MEPSFFGGAHHVPFFKPARAFGVVKAKCEDGENEVWQMGKKAYGKGVLQPVGQEEIFSTPTYSEKQLPEQNTRHFANCEGVTVEGWTDANYGNSYSSPGSSTPASDCDECSADDCVTNTGTVISVFTTNPQVTLPPVPSGLNECEYRAVQNFINTTLRAHEMQHVAAFNTYRGTVRTPYTYHGCASGLDAYTQQIHTDVESARKAKSDAKSAALDANGANIFNVSCDCPDPEPDNGE
ncbi:MAG: hypothetical protein JXA03_15915 [Bacteroidales bacterium]|nr:hypothetical protein [Bacteroidales bacterium]